jgi:predicted flap endonuclease-1-like 5' DNA nuclease
MMKRIAKLIGLVAALGVLIWLMKDRLISLVAARDADHPQFRPTTPPEDTRRARPAAPEGDDLQAIKGVGPVYETALHDRGFRTFRQVADASAAELAEHLGVPESRIVDWQEQASRLGG